MYGNSMETVHHMVVRYKKIIRFQIETASGTAGMCHLIYEFINVLIHNI